MSCTASCPNAAMSALPRDRTEDNSSHTPDTANHAPHAQPRHAPAAWAAPVPPARRTKDPLVQVRSDKDLYLASNRLSSVRVHFSSITDPRKTRKSQNFEFRMSNSEGAPFSILHSKFEIRNS